VRRDERREPRVEHGAALAGVERLAGRIRGRGVDDRHHDHHPRRLDRREADVGGAQDEERLRAARDRHERRDAGDEPVRERQPLRIGERELASRPAAADAVGLVDPEQDQRDADRRRDHGDPERVLEVAGERGERGDRGDRPEHRADGVERLAQSERGAAHASGVMSAIRASRGGAAHALADAVGEAREHDPSERRREREDRLGQRREPVAAEHERLALAHGVRPRAREHLDDERERLGGALEHADREHRDAETGREVQRQQRMDHLGREIHAQADQPQHDDAARDAAERHRVNPRSRVP
jgi:hypothetical protein